MMPVNVSAGAAAPAAPGTIDRRGLIVGGGALLAGLFAAQTGVPSFSLPFGSPTLAVDELSAAMFSSHIGSSFTVQSTSLALKLVEVTQTTPHANEPRVIAGDAFSLLLAGPVHSPLAAGDHHLVHTDMELPLLYVSPVGRTTAVQEYQVIIDRRIFDVGAEKEN